MHKQRPHKFTVFCPLNILWQVRILSAFLFSSTLKVILCVTEKQTYIFIRSLHDMHKIRNGGGEVTVCPSAVFILKRTRPNLITFRRVRECTYKIVGGILFCSR
jgi:hypothetical protein